MLDFVQTNNNVGPGPFWLATGDFNGDNITDVAVVVGPTNGEAGVAIMLGNGDGTFKAPVTYPAGVTPTAVVAGDFNNDGKLDLAVTLSDPGKVAILLGNGDG